MLPDVADLFVATSEVAGDRDLAIETCSDLLTIMPRDVTLKVFEGFLQKALLANS